MIDLELLQTHTSACECFGCEDVLRFLSWEEGILDSVCGECCHFVSLKEVMV